MGNQSNELISAKGIYTFTQKEIVEYTYGVVAGSWEEAKDQMENYNYAKIETGDFMGGVYLEQTSMRRKNMIRKKTCTAEQFTLKKDRTHFNGEVTTHYHNCTIGESNTMLVEVHWRDETPIGSNLNFSEYDPQNGCCASCSNKLRNGWVMIPRQKPVEDDDTYRNDFYTTWKVSKDE